ncbi:MAG: HU family DNA-binding protein [Sideroxydans sp.]|jgi:integration host factor subunit beta
MNNVHQRSDIIRRLAEKFSSLYSVDVDVSVRIILESIADSLSKGRRVEIRNFGSFDLNYHAQRVARNPKTGEKVITPAKYVPRFKAGLGLKERVDRD